MWEHQTHQIDAPLKQGRLLAPGRRPGEWGRLQLRCCARASCVTCDVRAGCPNRSGRCVSQPFARQPVPKDMLQASEVANHFVLGHFSHGSRNGVTSLTRQLPHVVKQLCAFMQACFPGFHWSSIAISHNELARPHRDVHNLDLNCSVSLGPFSGGGVWLEARGGSDPMPDGTGKALWGSTIATRAQPRAFPPSILRGTAPFQGERWALTAYTNKGVFAALSKFCPFWSSWASLSRVIQSPRRPSRCQCSARNVMAQLRQVQPSWVKR